MKTIKKLKKCLKLISKLNKMEKLPLIENHRRPYIIQQQKMIKKDLISK